MSDVWDAIAKGDLDAVKSWVQSKMGTTDKNFKHPNFGCTMISSAARSGHLPIIKYLVETVGCDVNIPNNGNNSTPLHNASYFGHPDCVGYLLNHRANPHTKNGHGQTPREDNMLSESNQQIKDAIEALFAAKDQPDSSSLSTQMGALTVDVDLEVASPSELKLFQAVWDGDITTIQANAGNLPLLKVNQRRQTLLYCAARQGWLDIVVLLVGLSGQNINQVEGSGGSTALHGAAFSAHCCVVDFLLDHGADPTLRNKYGLLAVEEAESELVKQAFTNRPSLPKVVEPRLQSSLSICSSYLTPYATWDDGTTPKPQVTEYRDDAGNVYQRVLLDSTSREFSDIVRCMNSTILTVHTSYKANPYCSFDVASIHRIQQSGRLECTKSRHGAYVPRYFFHGTSKEIVEKILNGTFLPSPKGDWGPGIYLAENSSTAHLFAMNKINDDGYCYMLVNFVNLGALTIYQCTPKSSTDEPGIKYINRPSDVSTEEEEKKKKEYARLCQSGNTVCCIHDKYHEFVVYNAERVYPAYVVKYKVVPGPLGA
eukprot:NODE_1218_length_1830_cov_91.961336_g1156_i0.p1 GENE.NODE_1218_length_1830_cov_91.961336_g1156_i0~~NODE_1218_length_1830_cov_91.961336_g1156_i0.p1  ORF type:complete len:541 (+),score=82.36 NODE_1218_length_1830_cov_91.961336_g1156_i0:59-1681(+)